MALAVDPTEREHRFFFLQTSDCFWQTTIAIKGYARLLKIIQDRLLHEAAGLLGTYKES